MLEDFPTEDMINDWNIHNDHTDNQNEDFVLDESNATITLHEADRLAELILDDINNLPEDEDIPQVALGLVLLYSQNFLDGSKSYCVYVEADNPIYINSWEQWQFFKELTGIL